MVGLFAAQMDEHGLRRKPGKDKAMNELSYTRVGDYYLPNIALSEAPNAPPLGRYGTIAQGVPAERKTRAVRHVVADRAAVSALPGD